MAELLPEVSPLEILEQRQLVERLQTDHVSDKSAGQVALHEMSQLPKDRSVYERRLNVFFRARPESVRARLKGAEAVRQQQLDAATRKFEAMKTHVEGRRDERRESLAQLEEAGRRLVDPIWKGFGEGERVQVVGLSKAPDFNGRAATVLRFDGERFAVRIDGAPRAVRIKPENLEPLSSGGAHRSAAAAQAAAAFTGRVLERA